MIRLSAAFKLSTNDLVSLNGTIRVGSKRVHARFDLGRLLNGPAITPISNTEYYGTRYSFSVFTLAITTYY